LNIKKIDECHVERFESILELGGEIIPIIYLIKHPIKS
jgi:hypothetical protein